MSAVMAPRPWPTSFVGPSSITPSGSAIELPERMYRSITLPPIATKICAPATLRTPSSLRQSTASAFAGRSSCEYWQRTCGGCIAPKRSTTVSKPSREPAITASIPHGASTVIVARGNGKEKNCAGALMREARMEDCIEGLYWSSIGMRRS